MCTIAKLSRKIVHVLKNIHLTVDDCTAQGTAVKRGTSVQAWLTRIRFTQISLTRHFKRFLFLTYYLQGPSLGIDIMYLVLANRNMQVRFGLKVVWES